MAVSPVPQGYHTITPYLIAKDAAKALEYYNAAFGATEIMRMPGPDGRVMHAEITIGDSLVMLADEFPQMKALSPQTLGGSAVSLLLYVPDVDKVFAQAIAAGGTVRRPVQDQFYGDRMGTLEDPFGHVWSVATHKEDLTPEEIAKRGEEAMKKMSCE